MLRKTRGKEVVLFTIILLISSLCTFGYAIEITGGNYTIQSGDNYDTVNVYNDASITMTGGGAFYCNMFDNATWDYYSGDMGVLDMNDTSIAKLYADRTPTMYLHNDSQIHIYNGGLGPSAFIFDNAELHIYGYDLKYEENAAPNWVDGYWAGGQEFRIILRNIYSYAPDQVYLHEVPEPLTLVLFAFSGFILRTARK